MRDGFSAIRQEIQTGDDGVQRGLGEEIRAGDEETRRVLREEIRAGDEETRRVMREEIRAGDEETRRVLREEIRTVHVMVVTTLTELVEDSQRQTRVLFEDLACRELPPSRRSPAAHGRRRSAEQGLLNLLVPERVHRAPLKVSRARSTLLTSNRPVDDWGKLLDDTAAITALLDRLLHHTHVLKCSPRSWPSSPRFPGGYAINSRVENPNLSQRGIFRRTDGGIHMAEWLERAINLVVGALVLVLVVRYRDRGILKRIGESKYRFRNWLTGRG